MNFESAVRKAGWEIHYLIQQLKNLQPVMNELMATTPQIKQMHEKMYCREIMTTVKAVIDFLDLDKNCKALQLDSYNSMYLGEGDVTKLFVQVRNALVHPTGGEGLVHPKSTLIGKGALPFYCARGADPLFSYEEAEKLFEHLDKNQDVRFGCGFLRISILHHVGPFVNFCMQELIKLRPKTPNTKTIRIPLVTLSPDGKVIEDSSELAAMTLNFKPAN